MKRLKWVVLTLLLAAVPTFAFVHGVSAQRFSSVVEKGQTVDGSLYSVGENVDINGTINGDVFCAGKVVTIDATVEGDVVCAAQDITVTGKVSGDVRLAGQTVAVGAQVAQSVSIAAMSFSLDANATVGRDLTATGDALNIKGAVGRDVTIAGSTLTLNSKVGRHVRAEGTQIRLKDDAAVAGNFTYSGDSKLDKAQGASVKGETKRIASAKPKSDKSWMQFNTGLYVFLLFATLLLSWLLAYFFPQFLRRQANYIKEGFGKSLLIGLVASFILPVVLIGLIVSVVGMPLSVVVIIAWLLACFLTGPTVGYFAGGRLLKNRKHPWLISTVGSILIVSLWFFPWFGFLFLLLTYWLGLGALLQELKVHARPFQSRE